MQGLANQTNKQKNIRAAERRTSTGPSQAAKVQVLCCRGFRGFDQTIGSNSGLELHKNGRLDGGPQGGAHLATNQKSCGVFFLAGAPVFSPWKQKRYIYIYICLKKKKGTMSWVLDFSRLNLSAHVPEEYEHQISTRRKETTDNFKTSQRSKTKHRTEATKLRTKTNNCPAKPKKDRPKYRFTTGSPRVHRRFTTGSPRVPPLPPAFGRKACTMADTAPRYCTGKASSGAKVAMTWKKAMAMPKHR